MHQQIVTTIRRNSERALKIIRSFERLPRSGIMADTPTEQVVELREIVDEVYRQLREMADTRAVQLLAGGEFPALYLDTGALELILIDLVSNAIKYSDPEKAERFVLVDGCHHEETYEIRVQDNGLGIPESAAANVFERFARARGARCAPRRRRHRPRLEHRRGVRQVVVWRAMRFPSGDHCMPELPAGRARRGAPPTGAGITHVPS